MGGTKTTDKATQKARNVETEWNNFKREHPSHRDQITARVNYF